MFHVGILFFKQDNQPMVESYSIKDNLHPGEEIIASATFHRMRDIRLSLLIASALGILFVLALGPLKGRFLNVLYGEHITAGFEEPVDKESNYYYGWEWGHAYKETQNNGVYDHGYENLGEISIDSFKHIAQQKGLEKSYKEYTIKNGYPSTVRIIVYWLFVFGLSYLTYILASKQNCANEFVKTNQRFIAKTGLFRHTTFEMKNSRVESIVVHQGLIGRILGYGTLTLCGTGATRIRIQFVVKPFEFRQQITGQ